MRAQRITLAADGRSDRCLLPAIRWAVSQALVTRGDGGLVQYAFALVTSSPLEIRLEEASAKYPSDILVVHRDAEKEGAARRFEEIARAVGRVDGLETRVPVVPIRMSEAWLLVDERAIREASGNPAGKVPLQLPRIRDLESTPDPKRVLRESILVASETKGRRRQRLRRDLAQRVQRVAELIDDYGVLRGLSAFRRFESDMSAALDAVRSA